MEATLQEKQAFVKAEIGDRSYSLEAFSVFCEQHKGTDLALYSLDELEDLVDEFKRTNRRSQRDVVDCQQMRVSQVVDGQLHVEVSQKNQSNTYSIMTVPNGWLVERKYSDFLCLREYLSKVFPHLVLPALPNMKDKYEEEKASCKVRYLNLFLRGVLDNYTLRRFRPVCNFLSDTAPKELLQTMKKTKKAAAVEELLSIDGLASLSLEDNSQYLQNYLRTITSFEEQLNVVMKQARQIASKTEELIGNMVIFVRGVKQLSEFQWMLFTTRQVSKDYFDCVYQVTRTLLKRNFKQHSAMNLEVYNLFEFAAAQVQPLKAHIKETLSLTQNYQKQLAKKEKAEGTDKPLKEADLAKLEATRKLMGVYSAQTKQDLDRSMQYWFKELTKGLDKFIDKMLVADNKLLGSMHVTKEAIENIVNRFD